MKYTEFKVGEKEYKLRLGANESVNLEKKLGQSALSFVMNMSEVETKGFDALPSLEDIITILHASLVKLNHGITLEKTYDIYDEYVDNSGNMMSLIAVLVDVLKSSGFLN